MLLMQAEVSVRRPEHPTKRSGPLSSLRRVSTSRVLAGVAVMLIVSSAVILGGVYYMLVQFGDELDSELDTQVQTVQRDFDRDVRRLQRDLERQLEQELDARLPAVPAPASP
jgi:predicted PurR-regulated permease PerM